MYDKVQHYFRVAFHEWKILFQTLCTTVFHAKDETSKNNNSRDKLFKIIIYYYNNRYQLF